MQLNALRLHLGSALKYLTKAANEQARFSSKGEQVKATRVSDEIIVEDRTEEYNQLGLDEAVESWGGGRRRRI
jgi:hypothetical protein